MMKSTWFKVFVLMLLVSIVLLAGPVRCTVRAHRFKVGYEAVQVGDSKDEVIKLLGQPAEISPCFHPSSESELERICADEFWYYSFLERWGISFAKDERVIHKTYNVSY